MNEIWGKSLVRPAVGERSQNFFKSRSGSNEDFAPPKLPFGPAVITLAPLTPAVFITLISKELSNFDKLWDFDQLLRSIL